jgi:hypothetical protein
MFDLVDILDTCFVGFVDIGFHTADTIQIEAAEF